MRQSCESASVFKGMACSDTRKLGIFQGRRRLPLPSALRDHQHYNADAFAAKGGADEGVQAKLSALAVCRYLLDKYDHPERLERMSARMRELSVPDAASKVADLIESGG